MRFIHTALSPNVETDDLVLTMSLLLRPWKWKRGNASKLLEGQFEKWLPARHAFASANGRTSLFVLLQALGLQKDDEVLLQAFTCVAVPEPVMWVKAKPVYVDCDLETLTMSFEDLEKKITSKSKVLILQHTFGNQCDIEKIIKLAHEHGLFVVEDCAHALGGQFHQAHLGTFGDAAFFSFGRDKVLSSVFGGMLTTNNDDLAQKIEKIRVTLPLPSSFWIGHQLFHPVLTTLTKKTYGFFHFGRLLLGVFRRLHFITLAVDPCEKRGERPSFVGKQLSNALALLAIHQFGKLAKFTDHRQLITRVYDEQLKGIVWMKHIRVQDTGCVWLRYPLRVSDPKKLLTAALARGMVLGDWYSTLIAPAGVDLSRMRYVLGSCPNAEQLSKEVINLPTHIGITENMAMRICDFLKKYEPAD